MPLIHNSDDLPDWCEMRCYNIVTLSPGESYPFERAGVKEKLIIERGKCQITLGERVIAGQQGTNLDLTGPEGQFSISDVTEPTTMVRVAGHWGDVTGGSGLWFIQNSDNPQTEGDPHDYVRNTNFDSHYHDYDEYWIFIAGRAIAVSERITYEVGPGDCIATGMGHHHDLPDVFEPVRAVFFETTLGGQGRRGHLWAHTHGPAEPQPERV